MNTRQILSRSSEYPSNCITDAYISTVRASSLRTNLESVETPVRGRGIYLLCKGKNELLKCCITQTNLLICAYKLAYDFLYPYQFNVSSYKASFKEGHGNERKAYYIAC